MAGLHVQVKIENVVVIFYSADDIYIYTTLFVKRRGENDALISYAVTDIRMK